MLPRTHRSCEIGGVCYMLSAIELIFDSRRSISQWKHLSSVKVKKKQKKKQQKKKKQKQKQKKKKKQKKKRIKNGRRRRTEQEEKKGKNRRKRTEPGQNKKKWTVTHLGIEGTKIYTKNATISLTLRKAATKT